MTNSYSFYKDTGVEWIGEIPLHWEIRKLKFDFKISKGKLPRVTYSEFSNELVPYLSMETLRNGTQSEFVEKNDGLFIKKMQLLILWDGSNSGEIIESNMDGILSSTMGLITNVKGYLDHKFSFYQLKSFEPYIKNNTTGMGIPHVNGQLIHNLILINPPIPEQTQIVEFLDGKTSLIDKLISVKQRKIELLKEKRTALLNHVVTKGLDPNIKMKESGVEWIGEIPEHWECKKLKYVSSIVYGISPPDTTYNSNCCGTVLVNGPVEYSESDFGETRSLKWTTAPVKFAKKGSLLFCLRGSTTGRMNIVHMDLSIGRGVCSINSNENQWFLIYSMFMVRIWIQEQISGSTFPSVTKDDVDNFSICSPPINEQTQIVSYLDEKTNEIDNLLILEQKKIDLLKEYRQSLISEVVTGKIKVTKD